MGNPHTLLGLLAVVLWSVTVGLARSLSEKVGPLAGGAAVYLVGGALCWAWRAARRPSRGAARESPMPLRYLLGCGALFVIYLLSFYLAIGMAADRVQVLGVGLANYLWPCLTIVFSLALLGKRAGILLAPGTAAALSGVFLAMAAGAQVSPAEFLSGSSGGGVVYSLAAAGAVMWALYSNLTSRWMGDRSRSGVGPFMLTTGVVLFLLALNRSGAPLGAASLAGPWTAGAAAEALGLGLATAVGYECWESAMRRGDVTLVAAASYFTPLLSTLFSCLYLGVRPGASLWAGCGLVVAGSLLSWRAVSSPSSASR
ncbi:MAG: aromatic amino acid DMT transporter YddG [Elusimicrobia bacterium]|nr:aromatic amino acid DMT transporter YddG [Elusimicrobiota bacterium]